MTPSRHLFSPVPVIGAFVLLWVGLWPGSGSSIVLTPSQRADQALNAFVVLRSRHRRQTSSKPRAFPRREVRRWKQLLQPLARHIPFLSPRLLRKVHDTLQLERDLDRQRYTRFPRKILQQIQHILRKIRPRLRRVNTSRRLPISRSRRSFRRSSSSKVSSRRLSRSTPRRISRPSQGIEVILGNQKPTPSMFPLPKLKDKHGHPVPESELPPLVLTERDLARVSEPTTPTFHAPIPNTRITSRFGWRRDPFTQRLRFHHGIDYGAPFGTPVYAAAAGTVIKSQWMGSCGLGVLLRHRHGFYSYYCHLSQLLVTKKGVVRRGSLIGKVGSTGRSTAPHLHFSILRNGRALNPLLHLSKSR